MRISCKNIPKRRLRCRRWKPRSGHSSSLSWVQSKAFFPSAQHSEFHTEGHSFLLNSQLMSQCVATLMLFRQLSFSTQTVNWFCLNRLLFDKSALPQIWCSTNSASTVSHSAVINHGVNLGNTPIQRLKDGEEKKRHRKTLGSYSSAYLKGTTVLCTTSKKAELWILPF